ncbi:MAG: M20 family metallopeptidase [Candidatus Bipolaricaulota bacterium]|nr:M20 family metallopeptidase [Candidatus Bipolaricaulota bacterium]
MTDVNKLKSEAEETIDGLRERMVELSTDLHENPELSYEEYHAQDLLVTELENRGFLIETGTAGLETAFRATYEGRSPGPAICLMAEYDALEGLGHACGHNLSGVASVGAAIGVKEVLAGNDLPGRIVVLGTPGEELHSGKVPMVEAGVFDDLDVAMMVHMFDRTILDPKFIAMEGIEFRFHGKSSHAAGAPEEGINALNGVIQTFENINALRQHVKDGVRIHGIITDGGSAINIVPETAAARFFVRADTSTYLTEVLDKVKKCGEGAGVATGADARIETFEANEDLDNNPVLTEIFAENIRRYTEVAIETSEESLGSTDAGDVSKVIPTLHPTVSIAPEGTSLHSEEFARASASEKGFEGMIKAAKGMALTALDLLTGASALDRVWDSFNDDG